jgi:hypothetical protein
MACVVSLRNQYQKDTSGNNRQQRNDSRVAKNRTPDETEVE